jgi:hypothetical protein
MPRAVLSRGALHNRDIGLWFRIRESERLLLAEVLVGIETGFQPFDEELNDIRVER